MILIVFGSPQRIPPSTAGQVDPLFTLLSYTLFQKCTSVFLIGIELMMLYLSGKITVDNTLCFTL